MAEDIIPEDVRQFILQTIDSVAQLECLLLLRANAETQWSAEATAKALYIANEQATSLLTQLESQGFLGKSAKPPPLYKYQPKSPELEAMIGRVASLYKQYLVPITHLIHSTSKTRVQKFADAFRIRKEKE